MAANYKRKADDNRIVELNSIGLSLTGIGEMLGVHHTTVTYRLKTLGIPPADTRRAFMEDIYERLSPVQQEWLISQLSGGHSIKDFVRSLLIKEFINRAAPAKGS
jgi:hypothetical protein